MNKEPIIKGQLRRASFTSERFNNESPNPIYKWWWEFMRLSPVFWYAKNTGMPIKDIKIREVFNLLDWQNDDFINWWRKSSVKAFGETVKLPNVKVLDVNKLHHHSYRSDALYLEIPLNMSKAKITKQINKEIKKAHSGRAFDVAKTTTANLKIYTWRYRLRTIEYEYWTLLYRLIYRDIEVWRIGDRLKISPALDLRNLERISNKILFDRMNSLVGRYLYKANFTLQNVERGTFPNPNKPINDNEKPFGEKEHFKYIKAITGTEEKESQYHRWIRKEYKDKLHAYIIDQNKLRRQMSISDSMTSKLFSDFVSGKTDFLNQEKYTGLIDIRNKSGGF